MIARIWRGITPASKSDEYLAYLERTGVKDYRATPGNRGIQILRRMVDANAEFLIVSLWESMEAIRKFAGPDSDKAVYYPEDTKYLLALEPNVRHYEVVLSVDER